MKPPLKLYKFGPAWDVPDISPFCVKLETYLRMAGHAYEPAQGDPRKAPKGKLPYLEDDGLFVGDSSLAIAYLKKKRGDALDEGMTDAEKARARALQSMLEEHLYFALAYDRWVRPEGREIYAPVLRAIFTKAGVPGLMQGFLLRSVVKQTTKQMHAQGIARHASAEVDAISVEIIDALATLLQGPYVLGDAPRSIDATVYAFLALIFDTPFEFPSKNRAREKANLVQYAAHMKDRYWSEAIATG